MYLANKYRQDLDTKIYIFNWWQMFKLFTGKMFAFGLILLLRDKVSSILKLLSIKWTSPKGLNRRSTPLCKRKSVLQCTNSVRSYFAEGQQQQKN